MTRSGVSFLLLDQWKNLGFFFFMWVFIYKHRTQKCILAWMWAVQLVLKMSVFFDMQVCHSVFLRNATPESCSVNGCISMCFSPAAHLHCMKIPSGGKTKRVLLAFVLGTIFVQVTLDPVFALLIHLIWHRVTALSIFPLHQHQRVMKESQI